MAKKEEKKEGFFESILKSKSTEFIYESSRRIFESFFESVRENVEAMVRFSSRYLGSYVLFLTGIIFVLISIVILLKEYFGIGYGWSLMIFGLIMLIVSLLMRLDIEKTKR
ncbi:MAG: hypothetical protein ACOCQX_01075 [Candidatus Nanoarchaeia archaeon]